MSDIKSFWDGLRPEPRLTVSEWADQHRVLSSEASAEPGPWRTSRVPYLREVMDNLSAHSPIEEVVVMKGSQIAFTEGGCNWIGYVMDQAPGPMLSVMPTDETMERNSKVRIDPMIEATPRLKQKIGSRKSKSGSNNTKFKSFPGGQLIMTGANSAASLSSLPIRYLFLDEIDRFPRDVDNEGSPIKLAEKRTATYSRRKIFKISTPTIDGQSAIADEFANTDQRRYFVPCPHCDLMQDLKFENLQWEAGRHDSAMYFCEGCGAGIAERYKPRMLANGEWRVTNPDKASATKRGYHLSALYSPLGWYSWAKVAAHHEASENDPTLRKTFVNTVLGEPYKSPGESPPWENIYNRRENFQTNRVYNEVAFITAGVDVQKDRLELEIVGWMPGRKSQSIDYRIIYGSTDEPAAWEQLGQVLFERWRKDDGSTLGLRLMGLDTGYNTQHCYTFAFKHGPTRVIPLKGADKLDIPVSNPSPIHYTKAGKRLKTLHVWRVGVGMLKSELYSNLSLEKREDGTAPDGYCHFPQYGPDYFKGLTCEKLEKTTTAKGYTTFIWSKPAFARNEPLDCRIYARAAASIVGIDRMNETHYKKVAQDQVAQAMRSPADSEQRPRQKRERRSGEGSFW